MSLSSLSLFNLCDHPFCLYSELLALLSLQSASTSYILTMLISSTLLALIGST
jgi:hypothetical protein